MSVVGYYRPVVEARTWKSTAALLLGLPFGIAWFTIVITGLSLSAGLMVTFVGLPLLMLVVGFGRVIGVVERAKVRALLGLDLAAFPRPGNGAVEGFWAKARARLGDGAGWRGIAYGILALPLGILWFVTAVVLWSVTLSFAFFPIYQIFLPDTNDGGPYHFGDDYVLHGWGRFGFAAGVTVIGWVLLGATPRIINGLGLAERNIVRGLLSPSESSQLEQRVEQLTVSRDASVEGSSVELRRIERDLHDGAQQRLVALAMDLGMAKERLAAGQDAASATALVTRAHDEAKLAISELRDLVRGIHPQVLTDRGLDAALSALAARSTVPVTVDVTLADRPPASIEAAAYFVVAEALTNLSKHSGASRAAVRVEQFGPRVLIDVRDDGRGGAMEHPGGGLSGLRDRVSAVEGTFRLSSPHGGPTEIHVELPCAS
ncbi:MAG: histidine kinase [Ilumatobacteraceae bacterium]|nr:histidine kinase [Ilumatobacteraceae bacterium]